MKSSFIPERRLREGPYPAEEDAEPLRRPDQHHPRVRGQRLQQRVLHGGLPPRLDDHDVD